jgi:hypothetical protein
MENWGACHFLAVLETITGKRLSRFLKYQSPLLQTLLAPVLPDSSFVANEVANEYMRRNAFEPALSICGRIHGLGLNLQTFGINDADLHSQVRNTLCQFGVLPTRGAQIDPIAEILLARYKVTSSKSWHTLLGAEYIHALGLLKQAEATFNSGSSFWLASQNSFNNAIFLQLQRHLNTVGHPASCKTIGGDHQLLNFGVMLDPRGSFSQQCPVLANCLREVNDRRNHLPTSHPYEKKTTVRCTYLRAQERNRFVNMLSKSYPEFIRLMP